MCKCCGSRFSGSSGGHKILDNVKQFGNDFRGEIFYGLILLSYCEVERRNSLH